MSSCVWFVGFMTCDWLRRIVCYQSKEAIWFPKKPYTHSFRNIWFSLPLGISSIQYIYITGCVTLGTILTDNYGNQVIIHIICLYHTLLAKRLCDSSFLGKHLDLIHSHFNMYGFRSYLFVCIIQWYVG